MTARPDPAPDRRRYAAPKPRAPFLAPMISTTGEYALRATVYLADHRDEPQTSAHIADGTSVPRGYLSKILQQLVRMRLVQSQRGIHGGFVLAREPSEISVLDVLRAVDSAPRHAERCPAELADHAEFCRMHRDLDDAVTRIEEVLARSDLETLCRTTPPPPQPPRRHRR